MTIEFCILMSKAGINLSGINVSFIQFNVTESDKGKEGYFVLSKKGRQD